MPNPTTTPITPAISTPSYSRFSHLVTKSVSTAVLYLLFGYSWSTHLVARSKNRLVPGTVSPFVSTTWCQEIEVIQCLYYL